jgi:hypothetical protein
MGENIDPRVSTLVSFQVNPPIPSRNGSESFWREAL